MAGVIHSRFAKPPIELPEHLGAAWGFLVASGGSCSFADFDRKFLPVGAVFRRSLSNFGVRDARVGAVAMMVLPAASGASEEDAGL